MRQLRDALVIICVLALRGQGTHARISSSSSGSVGGASAAGPSYLCAFLCAVRVVTAGCVCSTEQPSQSPTPRPTVIVFET
jgi:hypothetical protein